MKALLAKRNSLVVVQAPSRKDSLEKSKRLSQDFIFYRCNTKCVFRKFVLMVL
jgi:hypothetical protein